MANNQTEMSFELINRILHYKGRQAINRLRFLAQASPSLSLAAYELALQTITQSTWDIPLYKETLTAYNKIATANDLPPLAANQEWLDNTQTETSLSLARLENDLKHNTTNLIKDGIRTSYQELGKHYRRVGDLANAHRAFSKAREHATNALHAAELSLASLDLALDAENFKLAHSHAAKAQAGLDSLLGSLELKPNGTKNKPAAGSSLQLSSLPSDPKDPTEKDIERWTERVNLVYALTSLAQGDFGGALRYFLKVGGREAGGDDGEELLATVADIAMYATLCGLAHLDRQQLKEQLIDRLEFRSVLDSEPRLRQILKLFRENKYREVFEYLSMSLPVYQTDLYLYEQTERLMGLIQERAIGQYFGSFSAARLGRACEVFGWSMEGLEGRLEKSIRAGQLVGKLDLANGVLLLQHTPLTRQALLQDVHQSATHIHSQSAAALFRLKLISADLLVAESHSVSAS
ncbi:hypothetical protein PCASD_01866 [Puccinia coronata f. sp. avenae]|uniref:26S proteasome regulatory subunit Rpn7 N-terminal domain-containing protein n=1 Tax=Puccinia coronata f. sp. avenae TaxID=200324 RepID=A0A2N5VJK5_9BASI|nr:hypothetical protein PCASD_01866 [Puccinia coronata f. sp. avenae]